MKRVKIIEAHSCASQRDSFVGSEREAWISRQEASFIRGGVSPASARRLAERYYEIKDLRGDYSTVYVQNPDKSFSEL